MKYHKIANMFPMLPDDQLTELSKDIKANGQQEPILLFNGEVADGRNRLVACQKAKVKPKFVKFRGTERQLLDKVKSLNFHRRHLDESQRALVAAEFIEASKVTDAPMTKAEAAKQFNTSEPTLKRAGRVARKGGAKLKAMVMKGETSITKAAQLVDTVSKTRRGKMVLRKTKSIKNMIAKMGVKVGGPARGGLAAEVARTKAEAKEAPRKSIIEAVDGWWVENKANACSHPVMNPSVLFAKLRKVIVDNTL